jgi:carbon starvation protein
VFDTLDACTRLARYILMELFGWTTKRQAYAATALSLVVPVIAVAMPRVSLGGKELPLWQVFWGIFGSSNQLLAALTLLGVTVWLARKKLPYWIALWPTVFMMVMTIWSLFVGARPYVEMWRAGASIEMIRHFQFGITVTLIVLAVWLVIEAIITWRDIASPPEPQREEPVAEAVAA